LSTLSLSRAQLIAFILQDTDGIEVTELAGTFSVAISKDGSAFAAGSGVKAEIGSGWYSYELTAAETDTPGPLAIKVTGAGADQQNLLYQVFRIRVGIASWCEHPDDGKRQRPS